MADGTLELPSEPTLYIDVREAFGIDMDMTVKGFAEGSDRVPVRDETYQFDWEMHRPAFRAVCTG